MLGRRGAILLTNRLAKALLIFSVEECNYARFLFLDAYARELYPDWESVAADTAAVLRMEAGRHPTIAFPGRLSAVLANVFSAIFNRLTAKSE